MTADETQETESAAPPKPTKKAAKKKTAKKKAANVTRTKRSVKKKARAKSFTEGTPTKTCPQCGTVNHARKANCEVCQYAFPVRKKRRKKTGRKAAAATPVASTDKVSVSMLVAAKRLAEQAGGVKEARAALDALAKLS